VSREVSVIRRELHGDDEEPWARGARDVEIRDSAEGDGEDLLRDIVGVTGRHAITLDRAADEGPLPAI